MKAGVVRESFPRERRVALVPSALPSLTRAGMEVWIEKGAGERAGFSDAEYLEKGAKLADSREQVFAEAEAILQVRSLGANPDAGQSDLSLLRPGQAVIGLMEPLSELESAWLLAERGVSAFALELIPRITRAQSMDVLSSMANIAGYKAVLLAANMLPRLFPMMMTAAGTISPARVFVIGAGVAGLQAIATAKRLGAVVQAFDVRAAVKEQVQSLGARFVEFDLGASDAEDRGGYARELTEEQKQRQQELMADVVAESDVVITTAAVPGKKAPRLISASAARRMKPGSVIVDLAAERGGNCELTEPGKAVEDESGVIVMGPVNLPSEVPYHASQMFAKNIATFLLNLVKEGKLDLNLEDEIIKETLLCMEGKLVHPRLKG